MKAVVIKPDAPGRLGLVDVESPSPNKSEALVRVSSISLNRGEVRGAQSAAPGYRPGWDLAGIVEQAAADESGPKAGARVVGFMNRGAWAELVAVPTNALAELPTEVSFAQASTLPIAGLTALYSLDRAGSLLGEKVLITGATGGVGHLAVQLAALAGTHVVAMIRDRKNEALVKAAGADRIVISDDGLAAADFGPYHLILDGIGGQVIGNLMGMVAQGGTVVTYGTTLGAEATFDVRYFFLAGSAKLYGFIIFHEVKAHPAAGGLTRLVRLVAAGKLRPLIEVEASWKEIGSIADQLLNREFAGKAVLHLD